MLNHHNSNNNKNDLTITISPPSLSRHFENVTIRTNNVGCEHVLHVLQWNILAQGKILIYSFDIIIMHSMNEPFYSKLWKYGLRSSYRTLMNDHEPDFTTWKFKSQNYVEKEEIWSIDYIFYTPIAFLKLPTREEIGSNGLPCDQYPSDHLALETKFLFITENCPHTNVSHASMCNSC